MVYKDSFLTFIKVSLFQGLLWNKQFNLLINKCPVIKLYVKEEGVLSRRKNPFISKPLLAEDVRILQWLFRIIKLRIGNVQMIVINEGQG